MPTLLSLPSELRQQILSPCLPADVHNAGVAPRTAPLLPLLLTCRAIHLDVLELLKSWSPLYHIEDPQAFFINTLRRRGHRRLYVDAHDDVLHMRRISLRLFADLDLKYMRSVGPMGAFDEANLDVDAWLRCVAVLPRPGEGDDGAAAAVVESVVLDLTPVPVWMALRRPDWVRATVLDSRNKLFLDGCEDGVRKLAGALLRVYEGVGGAGVSVSLGGMIPCKARRVVETGMGNMNMLDAGRGGTVPFAGEWVKGPADESTRLRLALVCLCWGIDVKSPAKRSYDLEQRAVQVRNQARRDGLTTPDLDFRALGEVRWSSRSCTAYFVNAEADERRTREELTRMLAFAVDVRAETAQPDAAVDFEPAIRARRYLLHCLARDLGLVSVSIGDAGEKFVRVSRPAETSAEECGSPGEEEMTPAKLRAMQLRRAFRSCALDG